jgi:hypothetical protein
VAGLTTLLCKKKITVVKSKEVKPGYNLAESSEKCYGLIGDILAMVI